MDEAIIFEFVKAALKAFDEDVDFESELWKSFEISGEPEILTHLLEGKSFDDEQIRAITSRLKPKGMSGGGQPELNAITYYKVLVLVSRGVPKTKAVAAVAKIINLSPGGVRGRLKSHLKYSGQGFDHLR